MSDPSAAPPSVGKQLARRRRQLDIPQDRLARMADVTVTSVSKAENDRVAIRRGKRADWEKALRLRAGTITRAYEEGTPIEPLDGASAPPPPYADLTDRHERAVWEMKISESDRRAIIDLLRTATRDAGRRPA